MPDTNRAVLAAPERSRPLLSQALALCGGELELAERRLHELLCSPIASIPRVGGHLAFAGGKRFRPLLTLLSARACAFDDPRAITAAAVGELLHTATLLHDDVIDGGAWRRGRPAARLEFGNGMAVLTGDYCLARALQAIAHDGDLEAVRTMADMVTLMAEGEVAQLEVAGDWGMTLARYYEVIERKTATLIAWCASVGGFAPLPHREGLRAFGHELGFAFQIADDVLDYSAAPETSGKSRAQDLREGKATLPLLIACDRDPSLRTRLERGIGSGAPADEDELLAISEAVASSGALAEASAVAQRHAESAIEALAGLPPGPAREALVSLTRFVVRRDR